MPKFYLQHIRLNQGGYDSYGRYWGIGNRLYYYCTGEEEDFGNYLRAHNREDAKNQILKLHPNAKFFV